MYIKDDFLYLSPEDYMPINKKISGHSFVALAGLDPFKKPGDALLEMHRFIKPEIDPKWQKRGAFAEDIVRKVYKRDGYDIVTYDAKEIKYDNFPNEHLFGGIIDIEVPDIKTLIEVKSKSLDKKEFIVNNPPLNEVYQAMLYAYLRGYTYFIMEWIFFDELTEQQVFNGEKPTTLKNLQRYSKVYDVDEEDLKQKMLTAEKYVKAFRLHRRIPLSLISQDALEALKSKIKC